MNRPSIRRQWEKVCAELTVLTEKHEDLRDTVKEEVLQIRRSLDKLETILRETE